MSEFKPMVKMETTEPSAILKLKNGGHATMKRNKEEHGHKPMVHAKHSEQSSMKGMGKPMIGNQIPAETSRAPGKPSMSERMMAMKKNGGTVSESAQKPYEKTEMHTGKRGKESGTGVIKEANGGGYKDGGTISENAQKPYEKTEMHTGKRGKERGTGIIKEANGGGYKDGGNVCGQAKRAGKNHPKHFAEGGMKGENADRWDKVSPPPAKGENTDWENRSSDTDVIGVRNMKTGEVRERNEGGFKKGGMAQKKSRYADGGEVKTGAAEKMPHHFISQPVANTLQSGTFKKGGKVS